MVKNKLGLERIGANIRAHEKTTIAGVVAIGGLLIEAAAQCEHGEFMDWVDHHFGWSHATTFRYRRAFEFANICDDFGNLNLTLSALYFVASLSLGAGPIDIAGIRSDAQKAIIKKARKHRVTYSVAKAIFDKINNPDPIDPVEGETPPPPRRPAPGPPAPAHVDDESHDGDDSRLAAVLRTVLRYPEWDGAWLAAIKAIGAVEFRRLCVLLNAVVAKHCDDGGVRSAADRAEARARAASGGMR